MATVGNKAITKSDIVNEIKILLLLNNQTYSEKNKDQLSKLAMKTAVKRNIKQIAIERNQISNYNKSDLEKELKKIATTVGTDVETLKSICKSNDLDFEIIKQQVITELLWNSLIFYLYKDRLSINTDEIEEQLKLNQNKSVTRDFSVSEIVIKSVEKDQLNVVINEVLNRIKSDGFETVAMDISISQTSSKGGKVGWINENAISPSFRSKIINLDIGEISKPILIPEGILLFKVNDIKTSSASLSIEDRKNMLVNIEKSKILNMYSSSHLDALRRSIAVNYIDE